MFLKHSTLSQKEITAVIKFKITNLIVTNVKKYKYNFELLGHKR